MVRINTKREINNMNKKRTFIIIFLINLVFFPSLNSSESDIYKKIDLFGEVLEKINKEYVDEIDQSESMDSAINGLLQSLSEQVLDKLKDNGIKDSKIEGKDSNEWKLVDGIDLVIHIFHPEKRKFYELEKMWSELIPKEKLII